MSSANVHSNPIKFEVRSAEALQLNWGQRQILETLAAEGPSSRLTLAPRIGLSPQTMSRAIRQLISADLVEEEPIHSGARGQPVRHLRYRQGAICALGLSLSDNRIAARVQDIDGTVYGDHVLTGDFAEPEKALPAAVRLLDTILPRAPKNAFVMGLGIAAKGFFIKPGRTVVSRIAPTQWAQCDIPAFFESALPIPVTVCNNARAVAMGSMRALPKNSVRNALFVYMGNGIGGALVADGNLIEGALGNAGEIGALVPEGPCRPTRWQLEAFLGITDWSDWKGLSYLPPAERSRLEEWCRDAAGALTPAFQAATYMIDVETIYMCARFPIDIARQIAASIRLLPHGTMFLDNAIAERLVGPPRIEVLETVAMEEGACARAMRAFLDGGIGFEQLGAPRT